METVLLVALPWMKPDHMSIQLGGLQAYLRSFGIAVTTRHYYKDILGYLPEDIFYRLFYANAGEYLSLSLLFPENQEDIIEYLSSSVGDKVEVQRALKQFIHFVDDVVSDITHIITHIDEGHHPLIGFSTGLQQILTSLVVAKKLKEINPHYRIVFGGAVMLRDIAIKLVELFDQVDMIVYGEGEEPLRMLVESRAYVDETEKENVPNLVFRRNGQVVVTPQLELMDISKLPIPDYADYFTHSLSSNSPELYPKISVETSRGCFYGQCSFCNLNSQWLAKYRAKPDGHVYREILEQVNRYRTTRLLFVDSNVSNRANLFRLMASDSNDYHGWAEVSGHLTRDTFMLMRKAGIKDIQIGIESFSPKLLRDFKKGVTVMRNMELLKWCSELGFNLFYNLIIGYPTETPNDVQETLRVLRFAQYFQPPNLTPFVLSIESPIFQSLKDGNTEHHDVREAITIPLIPEQLHNVLAPLLSTIVGYESKRHVDWTPVIKAVEEWKVRFERNHHRPSLLLRNAEDFIVLTDTVEENERHIILEGEARSVYLACMDQARSLDEIRRLADLNSDEIMSLVSEMEELAILFASEGKYLSLAVPEEPRWN